MRAAFSPSSCRYTPLNVPGLPCFGTSKLFAVTDANVVIGMSAIRGFRPFIISNADMFPGFPLHGSIFNAAIACVTAAK